jgi:hypothetical protein
VLDEPTPGIALVGAATWNHQVHVTISFYLFGEQAAEVASREDAAWTRWQQQRFATG